MIRRASIVAVLALALAGAWAGDDLDLPIDKPEPPAPSKPKPGRPPIHLPPLPPAPPPPPVTHEAPPVQIPTFYGKDVKSETGSVVYVIDVSGSMGWDDGQYDSPSNTVQIGCRLDRAKSELERSLQSLPKSFKFNLEAYDCSTYVCFTTASDFTMPVVPNNDTNQAAALKWIEALKPGGGTGTGPAVTLSLYNHANRLVIVLTDGAPNCGAGDESGDAACMAVHLSQVSCANDQRAVIDVFGIGATGSFRQFCMDLASQNGGAYTDVK